MKLDKVSIFEILLINGGGSWTRKLEAQKKIKS